MTQEPDTNTGEPDIYSSFHSEDDRRQGCRNVSHFHQQSFSRLMTYIIRSVTTLQPP